MTNITIQPRIGHARVGPVGFVSYSQDFLSAYESFETHKPFSPSKYYLVCRSIELSLKAYLLTKNLPIGNLKKRLGHDLDKILRKSKELGFDSDIGISEDEKAELERANLWYKRKGFEYFSIENMVKGYQGNSSLPDLQVLVALANKLISTIKPLCLDAMRQPQKE
ncbi:hypothetical protein [uncultured Porticoccus sp.]|uniref:hypothetical protein n=1 Tax=uncultured Porticoccus sp. TaxID=1256050 RepID=UPI0030D782B8|tara:strand:+ start:2760 stop:3257 length:498 start_codon:yes stop_codon:yes gene_type:complete